MLIKKLKIVRLLFILLFLVVPLKVGAAQNFCVDLFSGSNSTLKNKLQSVGNSVKQYGRDVVDSRGVRLFAIKNYENVSYNGFFTPLSAHVPKNLIGRTFKKYTDFFYKNISKITLRDPSFKFTPLRGFNHIFMTKPFQWIARTKKVPTFLTSALMLTAYSMGFDSALSYYYDYRIESHKAQYIAMIEGDYRFHFIKESLDNHQDTVDSAIQKAYLQSLAIQNVAKTKLKNPNQIDVSKESERIINSNLFSNVRDYFIEGVLPKEGFQLKRQPGLLNEAEKKSLISISYTLYVQYGLVSDYIFRPTIFLQEKDDPSLNQLAKDIEDNGYRSELEALYKKHIINIQQYNFMAQEDYFYQSSFLAYKVLGISPLDDNGHEFTLNDVRIESLNEIQSK